MMLLPETRALGKGNQRKVDHERGKVIKLRIEVVCITARMLVVLVTNFTRSPSLHWGHKNSVVIDETQLPVFDDDVTVLQIAVGHSRRAQRTE